MVMSPGQNTTISNTTKKQPRYGSSPLLMRPIGRPVKVLAAKMLFATGGRHAAHDVRHGDDHAEVQQIDADGLRDRDEQRQQHGDRGNALQEEAEDQQDHGDDEQDRIVAQTRAEVGKADGVRRGVVIMAPPRRMSTPRSMRRRQNRRPAASGTGCCGKFDRVDGLRMQGP